MAVAWSTWLRSIDQCQQSLGTAGSSIILCGSPMLVPGGPEADLAWAKTVLREDGIAISEPPMQVRTWNLSSLWRIPTPGQTVWLKVVPRFLGP